MDMFFHFLAMLESGQYFRFFEHLFTTINLHRNNSRNVNSDSLSAHCTC